MLRQETVERFWSFVVKTKDCWVWVGKVNTAGYGCYHMYRGEQLAHRASWVLTRGEIPPGLCVLHTCDERRCLNPDHLWLGTNAENQSDKARKHRGSKPRTRKRLTDAQARSIRRLYLDFPFTHMKLAAVFKTSPAVVQGILRWRSYRNA